MPPKSGPFFNDGREAALHAHIMSPAVASTVRNDPAAVVAAISGYADTESDMMIFRPAKIAASRTVLESMDPKPKVLIELGGYVGCSALAWGNILIDLHGGSAATAAAAGCRVFSIELEQAFTGILEDFVPLAGLEGVVKVVQGEAAAQMRGLAERGELKRGDVDVLFIDHWEKFYLDDLRLAVEELGLLRNGGVVIADNTDVPGAPDYLEYVRAGGSGRENSVGYVTRTVETEREPEAEAEGQGGRGRRKVPNVLEVTTVEL